MIRIFIWIIYYSINGYPDSKLSVLSSPSNHVCWHINNTVTLFAPDFLLKGHLVKSNVLFPSAAAMYWIMAHAVSSAECWQTINLLYLKQTVAGFHWSLFFSLWIIHTLWTSLLSFWIGFSLNFSAIVTRNHQSILSTDSDALIVMHWLVYLILMHWLVLYFTTLYQVHPSILNWSSRHSAALLH